MALASDLLEPSARTFAFAVCTALVLSAAPATAVGRPHEPRVHPTDVRNAELLAVAEQSLRSGSPSAALEALWSIDDSRPKLNRFARARLTGVASFALDRFEDAVAALEEARALATREQRTLAPSLELLRGRAEHAIGRCEPALAALDRAGPTRYRDVDAVLVLATCHEEGGLPAAAIAVLSTGIAAADHFRLRAARARSLLAHDLREAAFADAHIAVAEAPLDAALPVVSSFLDAGAVFEATTLLRALHRRFPDDARPLVALSRTVTGREAAQAALEAARFDASRHQDAAELLRRDGAFGAALREGAGIADVRARLRARLAVLVDARAWDRALALHQELEAAALLDEDAVRYALAYAAYSVGDDRGAGALLDGIVDSATFERAARLRVAIAACAEQGELCAR